MTLIGYILMLIANVHPVKIIIFFLNVKSISNASVMNSHTEKYIFLDVKSIFNVRLRVMNTNHATNN